MWLLPATDPGFEVFCEPVTVNEIDKSRSLASAVSGKEKSRDLGWKIFLTHHGRERRQQLTNGFGVYLRWPLLGYRRLGRITTDVL